MEVILLEKIRNLGSLGERVKVKAGYGRNFLIPKGKAVYATEAQIEKFEARRAELEKAEQELIEAAKEKQKLLADLGQITIAAKAGEEGKLFGSINTRDIAQAIADAGVEIAKGNIILPQGAIRQVGEHEIEVELEGGLNAVVKIQVVSES